MARIEAAEAEAYWKAAYQLRHDVGDAQHEGILYLLKVAAQETGAFRDRARDLLRPYGWEDPEPEARIGASTLPHT